MCSVRLTYITSSNFRLYVFSNIDTIFVVIPIYSSGIYETVVINLSLRFLSLFENILYLKLLKSTS